MSTLHTILGTEVISTSRTDINNNFNALNSDKIETSYLDTDNTLAANSDTKIPSQKAVKTYVDTVGNVNASETSKGIVEEATDAEVTAGTATGATGAKLIVTPAKLLTRDRALLGNEAFVDARSNKYQATATSATWAHTIGEANCLLIVGFASESGTTVPTATYAGEAMTAIDDQARTGSTGVAVWFYKTNPSTGTNNIVVTGYDSSNGAGVAVSYRGGTSLTLAVNAEIGSASATTLTTTTTATGSALVVTLFVTGGGVLTSPNITTSCFKNRVGIIGTSGNTNLIIADEFLSSGIASLTATATFATSSAYGFIAGFTTFAASP